MTSGVTPVTVVDQPVVPRLGQRRHGISVAFGFAWFVLGLLRLGHTVTLTPAVPPSATYTVHGFPPFQWTTQDSAEPGTPAIIGHSDADLALGGLYADSGSPTSPVAAAIGIAVGGRKRDDAIGGTSVRAVTSMPDQLGSGKVVI